MLEKKSQFLLKTIQELAVKGKWIHEDRLKHINGSYSLNKHSKNVHKNPKDLS